MIRTDKLSFSIGKFKLNQISLHIQPGEYFVLLGPPGSGKTVLLECLCGLKKIDSGKIYIDGRNVTGAEPRMRKIGYVPQDYALFPHLSVERNIAFGLRSANRSPRDISQKVIETAETLGIRELLPRRINGLSGGEKQRTALARVLVLQPKVLLLDEPVCALDEATRQEICSLLQRIQRQLGLATIHVSHNLEEAFSVADNAAILNQGTLQQTGSLDQLLRKPKNEFVARFMRCENIFNGRVTGPAANTSNTRVKVGDIKLQIPGQHQGKVKFIIRPEDVIIQPRQLQTSESENKLNLQLVRWRDYGSYIKVELDGPFNLTAHLSHAAFARLNPAPDTELVAVLPQENIYVLTE